MFDFCKFPASSRSFNLRMLPMFNKVKYQFCWLLSNNLSESDKMQYLNCEREPTIQNAHTSITVNWPHSHCHKTLRKRSKNYRRYKDNCWNADKHASSMKCTSGSSRCRNAQNKVAKMTAYDRQIGPITHLQCLRENKQLCLQWHKPALYLVIT